jgi:hypothetical protein
MITSFGLSTANNLWFSLAWYHQHNRRLNHIPANINQTISHRALFFLLVKLVQEPHNQLAYQKIIL